VSDSDVTTSPSVLPMDRSNLPLKKHNPISIYEEPVGIYKELSSKDERHTGLYAWSLDSLGGAYFEEGRLDDAISTLEEAVRICKERLPWLVDSKYVAVSYVDVSLRGLGSPAIHERSRRYLELTVKRAALLCAKNTML
jgi:hypothetical protein